MLEADAGGLLPADAAVTHRSDGGTEAWCPIPGCASTSLPASTDLAGVWVGPHGEVWAVGEGGVVGRREPEAAGGAWCWCSPGPDVTLKSVWGLASDDVWIVGERGNALHFVGSGFTSVDVHASATLDGVWGTSPSNLFVVGEEGSARHFDGSAWQTVDVGADHQLFAVWGASASAIWAVGRLPTPPLPGQPDSGANAEVFRWQNGAWSAQASFPEPRGDAMFRGIAGTGPDDVWAVGLLVPSGAAAPFAFAAHFDGAAWTPVESPEDARINRIYTDVAPTARGSAWITASGDTCVRFDGSTWTAADASTADLLSIDGRDGNLWATGRDGKVLRRGTSGAWTVDLPATP